MDRSISCTGRGSNCPRGNSTCTCGERPAAQTAPGFLFPLHMLPKVFICPLLTGKQVRKGHSLSHPASRCCSSTEFLAALVGSVPRVPWIIPASLLAEHQASQLWVPAHHSPQQPVSRATGQHYTLGASDPGLFLDREPLE